MSKYNYAIENGCKYFMSFEEGTMKIIDIVETGLRFESRGEWMCNGSLCHKSLRDCLESIRNYQKPVMYKGENINVWQPDIFLSYNRYTGEIWRDYHFDDSILRKYENIA